MPDHRDPAQKRQLQAFTYFQEFIETGNLFFGDWSYAWVVLTFEPARIVCEFLGISLTREGCPNDGRAFALDMDAAVDLRSDPRRGAGKAAITRVLPGLRHYCFPSARMGPDKLIA